VPVQVLAYDYDDDFALSLCVVHQSPAAYSPTAVKIPATATGDGCEKTNVAVHPEITTSAAGMTNSDSRQPSVRLDSPSKSEVIPMAHPEIPSGASAGGQDIITLPNCPKLARNWSPGESRKPARTDQTS
jgi:hypothetical protein